MGFSRLPGEVRFYGGLGSGEYTRVWISTNGFIAFDLSNSTSPSPSTIPNVDSPNAFIAALWTDLNVDGSASIITGIYTFGSTSYFVVIWDNVLHKASGKRLIFQIILEDAPGFYPADRRYHQSNIWISYKSVSAINTNFTVGIEDHEGWKGHGELYSGAALESFNGKTIRFRRYASSYFLRRLSLSFYDTSAQTRIDIGEEPGEIRGYHILWNGVGNPKEPAPAYMFGIALAGTAVLLLGGKGGILATISAVVGTALVTLEWAEAFASLQYSHRKVEVKDHNDGLVQQAIATADTHDYVVDASLSLFIHWIFDDPNNADHSLTITATIEYYEYTITGSIINMEPLSTSVTLNVRPDSAFDGKHISEGTYSWLYIDCLYDAEDNYYVQVVYPRCSIIVRMTPKFIDDDFDLYLYDPDGNLRNSSKLGAGKTEEVIGFAEREGTWRIKVDPTDDNGFYSLQLDLNMAPYTPLKPLGASSGYVYTAYSYGTRTEDPEGDNVAYEFSWGDNTTTITGLVGSGEFVRIWHSWVRPGSYLVRVRARDVYGGYSKWSLSTNVTITQNDAGTGGDAGNSFGEATLISPASYAGTLYLSNPTDTNDWYQFYAESGQLITVHMTPPQGVDLDLELYDGTGRLRRGSRLTSSSPETICFAADLSGHWRARIYIFSGEGRYSFYVSVVWPGDGEGCPMLYVWNGSEYAYEGLLNIHNPEGVDVVYEHVLVTTPRRVGGAYLLWLVEHPKTKSRIDMVRLYAILENGEVRMLPLIWAWHSEYGNVRPQLLRSDERKAELLGASWNRGASQSINLKFAALNPNMKIIGFIFKIEGNNEVGKPILT